MTVNVSLFALAREVAGTDSVEIELGEDATVGRLRAALVESIPALAPVLESSLIAVNEEYAADADALAPGAAVAVIPPVSGG